MPYEAFPFYDSNLRYPLSRKIQQNSASCLYTVKAGILHL